MEVFHPMDDPHRESTEKEGGGEVRAGDVPISAALVAALPERVAHRYREAWQVQTISPTACAILVGSTLEAICAHEHVAGATLPEKLNTLAQRKRLPPLLVDIAHALRYLRNIGSHESEEAIVPEDLPAMLSGLELLVSYLYLLPQQRAVLEERLQQHLAERRTRLAEDGDESGR